MPRGSKSSYSSKQKRQAQHIEDSYRSRGVKKDEAEERAWRTVNKRTGGARGSSSKSRSSSRSRASSARKSSGSRSRAGSRRRTTRSRSK
jgi:hypothetical protein